MDVRKEQRTPEEVISAIAAENEHLDIGALKPIIDNAFAHVWMYLFELLQNALDAGATRVAIDTAEDSVVFQHDAPLLFDEASVRAISKVGHSTKGLDTVGFMGIGFKSVFHRFRHVRISDGNYRFAFRVEESIGRYDSRHLDWHGCVTPLWDADAPAPEPGYCTRFELSWNRHGGQPPSGDVLQIVDRGPQTVLPVLGLRGLRELRLDGDNWNIDVDASTQLVNLRRGENHWQWRVFRCSFAPTNQAKRALLEHRNVRLRATDPDEPISRQREVSALVKVGFGAAPSLDHGKVLATLPTEAEMGLRLSIQADWLLDITRAGLMDVQESAWQREIVEQIPLLTADVVRHYAHHPGKDHQDLRTALELLRFWAEPPKDKGLDGLLLGSAARSSLANRLRDIPFVPVQVDGAITLRRPADVVAPPWVLVEPFVQAESRADLLFGGPVVHPRLVDAKLIDVLSGLGLVEVLDCARLSQVWPVGLEQWWQALDPNGSAKVADRLPLHIALLRGLIQLGAQPGATAWRDLPCLPAENDHFARASQLFRLDEEPPSPNEPGGEILLKYLAEELNQPGKTPQRWLNRELGRTQGFFERDALREWYSTNVLLVSLVDRILAGCTRLGTAPVDTDFIRALAGWAQHRNRPKAVAFVSYLDTGGKSWWASPEFAVKHCYVGAPYVSDSEASVRMELFAKRGQICGDYLTKYPTPGREGWRRFFEESLGLPGPFNLCKVSRHFEYSPDALEWIDGDAKLNYSTKGYDCTDWELPQVVDEASAQRVHVWLVGREQCFRGTGRKEASGFYRSSFGCDVKAPASWLRKLSELAWVPARRGTDGTLEFLRPRDVALQALVEDDPICQLDRTLLAALQNEGLAFGTAVPRPGAIRALKYRGAGMDVQQLAETLAELLREIQTGTTPIDTAAECLMELALPFSGGRVQWRNLAVATGSRGTARSSLGDFVAQVRELPTDLHEAIGWFNEVAPIPPTTTGEQALRYLMATWQEAARNPKLPAETASRVLPLAYRYVLDDAVDGSLLLDLWNAHKESAYVFARAVDESGKVGAGSWVALASNPAPLLDDIDGGNLTALLTGRHLATASHIADADRQQSVAKSLGIELASTWLAPEYEHGPVAQIPPAFRERTALLVAALATASDREALDFSAHDHLQVRARGSKNSLSSYVDHTGKHPVLRFVANLRRNADSIATRLVCHYERSTQAELAALLTSAIKEVHDAIEFDHCFGRICAKLGVDPNAVAAPAPPVTNAKDADTPRHDNAAAEVAAPSDVQTELDSKTPDARSPLTEDKTARRVGTEALDPKDSGPRTEDSPTKPTTTRSDEDSQNKGQQSPLPDRGADPGDAHPKQAGSNRKSAKARPPGPGPDLSKVFARAESNHDGSRDGEHHRHSDAAYRDRAAEYERNRGCTVELLSATHPGFDLSSTDPSGNVRHIEIKGSSDFYDGVNASVVLSQRQYDDALRQLHEGSTNIEYWLYVVAADGVWPIPWTRERISLSYVFYASAWRDKAVLESAFEPDAFSADLDMDLFEPEWRCGLLALHDARFAVHSGGDVIGIQGVVGQTVAVIRKDGKSVHLVDATREDAEHLAYALEMTGNAFLKATPDDDVVGEMDKLFAD